ncbi:thioesterase II family protein [Streptomyces sp. A012304]|uniref:thioesterase II family protein n=1 Tax=Streptomyces sp. A012304 TaxID=375446 RepID=UPI0022306035|nr:alpha/beta fold hydrolase [Streptomyces sp. A012304]GKQ38407.1 pyochelin biosynthetic protein PchC [Streptomyces sp. A012304]
MSGQFIRPLPRPQAPRVLLCLSFCGGGTAPFRPWADSLPEDTELALYCYPGREARYSVPFARDWEDLLGGALAALHGLAGRRVVLCGHSMGAWVAFDLAVRARRAGLPDPEAVVVSAARAPHTRAGLVDVPPHPRNTDQELLDWMLGAGQLSEAVRGEPELLRMAVEVFRADLCVADSYRFRPQDRVTAPLQVLYGEDDDLSDTDADAWRPLSTGPFKATRVAGGHFYTPTVWPRLPEHMAAFRTGTPTTRTEPAPPGPRRRTATTA